ncbi:hypothetical protein [Pseudomonas sp. SZMC_28357]|uniref:hypothetical protein n=1 Tax=Pseudomonas sp. SZMC_28357 TaxID=3074380 RepID=UPI002877E0F1|nr:hypothetical protein [Pseudomonas sp. SZMC_28357]
MNKNRDLLKRQAARHDCAIFDQSAKSHVIHGLRKTANILSTDAPTDFGGNSAGAVENRAKRADSVAYTALAQTKA